MVDKTKDSEGFFGGLKVGFEELIEGGRGLFQPLKERLAELSIDGKTLGSTFERIFGGSVEHVIVDRSSTNNNMTNTAPDLSEAPVHKTDFNAMFAGANYVKESAMALLGSAMEDLGEKTAYLAENTFVLNTGMPAVSRSEPSIATKSATGGTANVS